MSTPDKMLTEQERELAQLAIEVGNLINNQTTYQQGRASTWVEDIIPPATEGDVLSSTLYTMNGDPEPKSGFTLWRDDKAYEVTFEIKEA